MAQYDGSIRINTELNTRGFNQGANRLMGGMERLGGSIKGLMGALGLAIGIAGLVKLGKEAIETASDIQEVQNVVDTAFGDMAYKMEQFANVAVKQFGMSKLSAKQMGSTFMAMGASMVGSMEDASDMAIALTGRAADMASFYNKSAQETATALKSIYTGETETLKEYGVVMTEVNLQEYAAEKGIRKKISAMTQAEKVQLRYNYVMEQTALSAGDFAKTSDSWANQTRILSEQFKELLSVLGSGLITAFTPVVQFLNTVLTQLIAIASQIGAVMSRLLGISVPTADAKKFSEDMSAAAGGAEDVADGIEAAGKEAKKALAPFDDLMVLADKSGGGKGGTGAGAAGGGFEIPKFEMEDAGETPIEDKFIKMADNLKNIMLGLFEPLKTAWENQGQFVMDSWKYALGEIGLLAKSVGSDFLEVWEQPETTAMLENILIIIGDIGVAVGNLAAGFREAWGENDAGLRILGNVRDIFADITGHIRNMADATVAWTETLDFSPLLESVNTLLEALKPLSDNIGAGLEWFYINVLLPLAGWAVEDAVPAFLGMLAAAIDVANSAIEALKPLAQWLWDSFLQPLAEWTGGQVVSAMETITGLLEDFSGWISENGGVVASLIANIGLLAAAWVLLNGSLATFNTVAPIVTKALTAMNTLMTGGLLGGVGMLSKLANVFALVAGGAGTLNEALVAIFGTVTTMFAGIATVVGGVITAVTNFVSMLQNGFSWLNEILMVAGIALTAVGAVILGVAAAPAALVAAIVAAVATIAVVVHDNWDAICAWLSGVAGWINTNVIQPVVGFFKGLWTSVSGFFTNLWNDIVGVWGTVSGWFNENIITPIVSFFVGFATRVGQIFEGLWIIIQAVWVIVSEWFNENVITPIATMFTDLWTWISEIWAAVSGWFNENVIVPVVTFFQGLWESVSGFFASLWEDVKAVWDTVFSWFDKTVITPVENAFKTACDAIGGFFASLWKGIRGGVVGAMNAVIGGIETAINWIVDGINDILGGFNRVVSWAAKVAEVNWGGVDLVQKVSLNRIPALASGAVIRGGNPFIAMLGDQPSGVTNIETPLPTMVDAFKQAISESGGIGGRDNVPVNINVIYDGEVTARVMIPNILAELGRQGYNVEVLGVT